MVQSVNNSNIPIEPNPVGGSQPNSSKVTENKTAQFETSVQKLQENFLNDAKLLKASRTVRSFGDIFTANDVKGKGFFGGIKQIFANIKLYKQDPEKLLRNVENSMKALGKAIAEACQSGNNISESSTEVLPNCIRTIRDKISELKDDQAVSSKYGEALERLLQPKEIFKELQNSIGTLTQSVIDRCKAPDGLSSKDIQSAASDIQTLESNITRLKKALEPNTAPTAADKAIKNFLGGFLREDVFLLEDFSKNLIQACTLSENLNDQNFKESFGNIEKLKSEFNPKEKFGGYLFKDQGDFANPAAHALKQAAFKFIDQNIKKFIGIDDFIEKTKNELKNRYPSDENRQDFELRQACGKYRREHSDRIESLKSFITTEQEDLDLKDIRKEFEGQLNRLNEWCLTKKFDT